MSKWTFGVTLLSCVLLSSGPALAATEFTRGQTTVTVGDNTIAADNNVKFVDYDNTEPETLTVILHYSATCNIVFGGLTVRLPQPFTPNNGKVGATTSLVSGTPSPDEPSTSGSATFTISFSRLKPTGSKSFGVAHGNLLLGVDSDCDTFIDDSVTIGVQLSVSTASHP